MSTFTEDLHPRSGDGKFATKAVDEADGGTDALGQATGTFAATSVSSNLSEDGQALYDAVCDRVVDAHRRVRAVNAETEPGRAERATYLGFAEATSEAAAILADPDLLSEPDPDERARQINDLADVQRQLMRHDHRPGRHPATRDLTDTETDQAVEYLADQIAYELEGHDAARSHVAASKSDGRLHGYTHAAADMILGPAGSRIDLETHHALAVRLRSVCRPEDPTDRKLDTVRDLARAEQRRVETERALAVEYEATTAVLGAEMRRRTARRELDDALDAAFSLHGQRKAQPPEAGRRLREAEERHAAAVGASREAEASWVRARAASAYAQRDQIASEVAKPMPQVNDASSSSSVEVHLVAARSLHDNVTFALQATPANDPVQHERLRQASEMTTARIARLESTWRAAKSREENPA
ncbi:hypothetical protein [Isoptericola croceus]|uniref:hypothetical protein n=1 Tax=Isoptericola croceus TaxID=3031406 RepID=UPI0023F9D5F2|nr:hypothetical protein [Isoptericola croceus]